MLICSRAQTSVTMFHSFDVWFGRKDTIIPSLNHTLFTRLQIVTSNKQSLLLIYTFRLHQIMLLQENTAIEASTCFVLACKLHIITYERVFVWLISVRYQLTKLMSVF